MAMRRAPNDLEVLDKTEDFSAVRFVTLGTVLA
jgi:hypothetical protein